MSPRDLAELDFRLDSGEQPKGRVLEASLLERTPNGHLPRIVLADDWALLREGVARILAEAGFPVVGQAGNAAELLEQVAAELPAVAIVDIWMPPGADGGLCAVREILSHHPRVGVLVLFAHARPSYDFFELLSLHPGRVGCLLKDRIGDPAELADAVRRVARGGSVLDPVVVSQLVDRQRQSDTLGGLSERERDVLSLMANGRANRAIARRLYITERTVEKHVSSIFGKLQIAPCPQDHRRVLAVLAYLRAQ